MKTKMVILTLLIAVTGCKKEALTPTGLTASTSPVKPSTDNILKFSTVEEFEELVSHENHDDLKAYLSKVASSGFRNYFSVEHAGQKNSATQEMDEELGQLLNEDGAIQIGDHIYKIDLAKNQVFVISVENMNTDYQDLINGNTRNPSVSAYATEDDVLYLVNNDPGAKCGGVGGGTYKSYADIYDGLQILTFPSGIVWRLNPFVIHFTGGIYFKLSSNYEIWAFPSEQAISNESYVGSIVGSGISIEMFIRWPQAWWKKRPCDAGSIGTNSAGLHYIEFSAGDKQVAVYSGSRNLNGYYFFIQGRARETSTGNVTVASPYAGRNINSPY